MLWSLITHAIVIGAEFAAHGLKPYNMLNAFCLLILAAVLLQSSHTVPAPNGMKSWLATWITVLLWTLCVLALQFVGLI